MKKLLLPLTLLLLNTICFAGFPPFTAISSNNITIGSEIFIGYDPLQNPCLQSIVNFQGDSQYISIDTNNHIEITISALGFSPCLNIGVDNPPYQYHSLGILPVGQYTVQMYWAGTSTPLPVPVGANRIAIGGVLPFGVVEPVIVPSLNHYSLLFLCILFLIITFYLFNVKGIICFRKALL